ncbi:MAG: DsbA family oxidoreductase [Saprospiraceae bacterium]|nr:DsbA family oxidoreductase [Saprospiraceae bacterium]
MKVEIWSDVMCPFCYIGKRRLEAALEQFPHRDQVEVVWKSFQLDPGLKTDPGKSVKQSLAEKKGWSPEQTEQSMAYVVNMAREVGLTYHFDKAVVANSFDAHRFSHLAKKYGKQDEAEERLFAAYFVEGKNTADHETLIQLGTEIGLDPGEVARVLSVNDYAEDVQTDIYESRQVGVSGVPFFVFEDKYTVSGAQRSALFLQVLEKVWEETNSGTASRQRRP